jgi:hypothetical protein
LDIRYKKEILEFEAFQSIFYSIKKVDPKMGANIEQSLMAAVKESHNLLRSSRTKEQLEIALIKEQIFIQAQSSQYLNITDEITLKKNSLLEFMPKVYHGFMDEVEQEMLKFFNNKKETMFREIDRDGSWYSGLRDTGRKSGQLVNFAIQGVNRVTKEFNGKEVFSGDHLLDTKTIVETVLENHLSHQQVTEQVTRIFEQAIHSYKEAWMKHIVVNLPDLKRLSAFTLTQNAKENVKIEFQYGEAEKVLAMGLTSAVFGTVGLAMGWHTLTYAMFNVFPPIAIFAAIATVVVGVLTKDKSIEKRKKDVQEAVTRYYQFFLQQLYVLPLKELENKSISEYIESKSQAIVDETVREWEKRYFGKLSIEHFRQLNQAFIKHLVYVNEAIEELE